MSTKALIAALLASSIAFAPLEALAGSSTIAVSPGSGVTMRIGTDGSGNGFGNQGICDFAACVNGLTVTASGAAKVDGSAVTQPISASTLPLPTGASTSAGLTTINTTLGSPFQAGGSIGNTGFNVTGTLPAYAATPTFNLGTIGTAATAANQTNVQGVIGAATAPTSMTIGGLVYNSSPLTLTTGQSSALQADANGYLKVNVAAGGAAGGTSSNFSATFPTLGTAAGAEYLSSAPTLTSGQMVALQVTSAGSLHTTVDNTNGNGSATSANSSPVVIASDQAAVTMKGGAASGSAVVGNPNLVAGSDGTNARTISTNTSGQPVVVGAGTAGTPTGGVVSIQGVASGTVVPVSLTPSDPCTFGTKTNLAISTNATALTQIIAASGSTKIYICSVSLIAAGASAVNLITGTGTNCGTGTAALYGSTTAANGMSLAANGGFTSGSGSGTVAVTAASSELCTLQSNAVYVSGNLTYVQQ